MLYKQNSKLTEEVIQNDGSTRITRNGKVIVANLLGHTIPTTGKQIVPSQYAPQKEHEYIAISYASGKFTLVEVSLNTSGVLKAYPIGSSVAAIEVADLRVVMTWTMK